MNKERYEKWMRYWDEHPERISAVQFLTNLLSIYFIYAYLDLLFMNRDSNKLIALLAVPGIAFALLTLLRALINGPRPSEVYGIPAAVYRKNSGHSFPSRHTFSAFMITFSAFYAGFPNWGILLLVLAAAIALMRVISGLHFVSDVAAGALAALAAALIGYGLFF